MKRLLTEIKQLFNEKNEIDISHLEKLGVILSSLISDEQHYFVVTKDRSHFSSLFLDMQTYFFLSNKERNLYIFPEILAPISRLAEEQLGEVYAFLNRMLTLGKPTTILLTEEDYNRYFPEPNNLKEQRQIIEVGKEIVIDDLRKQLTDWGYDYEEQVEVFGEFACRGGIFDIFCPLYSNPFRLEFFGNEIESIRQFNSNTQRSIKDMDKFTIIPYKLEEKASRVSDYLKARVITVDVSDESIKADIKIKHNKNISDKIPLESLAPLYNSSFQEIKMQYGKLQRKVLFNQLKSWLSNQYKLTIFCGHKTRVQRLKDIIQEETDIDVKQIAFSDRPLNYGFIFELSKTIILSEDEVFGRLQVQEKEREEKQQHLVEHTPFETLEVGQYVVHATYGICYYHKVEVIDSEDEENECMVLEFANDKKMYLPISQSYLITRYKGGSKDLPKLSSMSSNLWQKGKDKVVGAVKDTAAQLLRLQALRQNSKGFSFSEETEWEGSFAQAFPFVETADQMQAISEVKQDMEKKQPMDRLLCGDVGFGKTEVAMRAAFKAVMGHKQVGIIVPTTILSQQHFINFSKRMADYPVNIAVINRLVPLQKQREILESLMLGQIDIIIGTHRLAQKDVIFSDLGLIVVDEEQKFGVEAKEFLKGLKLSVDVLTMTATPIPRTLYHSLAGLRDLSTLTTPPKERKAIKTIVIKYDEDVIVKAIKYELSRGGQVYFLHNRVASIDNIARRLKLILPEEVRIAVGHGQMDKTELEDIMNGFFEHRIDILVCTTIIESGLDVPNANTILVDRADNFGLSSLYQLRGRVGRDINQAYAYFLIPDESLMTTDAQKRLSAMNRYTQLGSGLKLALRDLEIRGAGNLLGIEQSGHIAQVGFELYCQLLKTAVESLKSGKKEPLGSLLDIQLDFLTISLKSRKKDIACFPPDYIESVTMRIEFYKYLQKLDKLKQLDDFAEELIDRFGKFPQKVMNLLLFTRVKINMLENNYQTLRVFGKNIILKDIKNNIIREQKSNDYYQLVSGDAQDKLIQLINLTSK